MRNGKKIERRLAERSDTTGQIDRRWNIKLATGLSEGRAVEAAPSRQSASRRSLLRHGKSRRRSSSHPEKPVRRPEPRSEPTMCRHPTLSHLDDVDGA